MVIPSDFTLKVKYPKFGGFIHDIGKFEIPMEILYKENKLTDEEFQLIKEHPIKGVQILSKAQHKITKDVIDIVLQHHEQIDGEGYPYHLKDQEINPLAKIVSLCDVYSAIVSKRSYKKAFDIEYALSEIQQGLGKQFDHYYGYKFIDFVKEKYSKGMNGHIKIL